MIEALLLVCLAIVAALLLWRRSRSLSDKTEASTSSPDEQKEPQRQPQLRRRAVGRRQQDTRGEQQKKDDQSEEEEDDSMDFSYSADGKKIGVKKARKLAAKEQKRRDAEATKRMREDAQERKRIEEEAAAERQRHDEDERKQQREEEERIAAIQRQKEQEEYDAMKASFVVEESGTLMDEQPEPQALLERFIDYIKANKVVILEDLATEFGLKTKDAIGRLSTLQDDGRITGVIDDRGKFIYITKDELESVAKFVQQSGRISIDKFVDKCSELIRLQSIDDHPIQT